MTQPVTTKIANHRDLKTMSTNQLTEQADIIRQFLLENIAKTGGHIGANLSVVELTVAIHSMFDSPTDKIIFDTGHQGYTHKLLTEREHLFASLNTYRGMSRFVAREESEHDAIDASHAGTSLSLASGYAKALHGNGNQQVVAVIGDGSLVEGMAFEGLNYCAAEQHPNLTIVINDNEMAIAKSVGGVRNLTAGDGWQQSCKTFFEAMGFDYIVVEDGHDIGNINNALNQAKSSVKTAVVHVKTEKGKGLACAKDHPYKMHFSMPYDPETGAGASATVVGRTYAVIAAEQLEQAMAADESIYAITPATPYASSMDACLARFPERALDVGMAEQHAVGMACGLALGGKKPVVCMQTTFMQRAYDQLIHDACYMDLPVTMFGVRAGFAGYDGATHHGLYDLPYLRSFPNMQIVYPGNAEQFSKIINKRLDNPTSPMTILYPYEPVPEPEAELGNMEPCGLAVSKSGVDGFIVCLGNKLADAYQLSALLNDKGKSFGVICIQSIKPFPADRLNELIAGVEHVITMEESVVVGGLGSAVIEAMSDAGLQKKVYRAGVNDMFVQPGAKNECAQECGLLPEQILDAIENCWGEDFA
ncbi:1-deoxy-D-xylulose-5-phosphate synthase [Thalassotalea euphylliae]|uniref:1-deoxy-D-xylulose-5-phosphate synthase n=1 Tax=Thalassotalea euphylliae TaxID=1655234 RepID=UPI0036439FBE